MYRYIAEEGYTITEYVKKGFKLTCQWREKSDPSALDPDYFIRFVQEHNIETFSYM